MSKRPKQRFMAKRVDGDCGRSLTCRLRGRRIAVSVMAEDFSFTANVTAEGARRFVQRLSALADALDRKLALRASPPP